MVLKHYKCPTVIVLPPCNRLFELDFRLCGCAGIRLWCLFILDSNRKAIWLFSKLAIHWSMLLRPCVHSSFCLSVTSILPYSSVIFTVSTCETVSTVFSWAQTFKTIAGFHCHAIKIKIENRSINEVKKFTRYRR